MGSKDDGFKTDHLLSKCCQEVIRVESISDGYSLNAWCSKCGTYCFAGRTESLIALWIGDTEAVMKNKGFIPSWLKEPILIKKAKKILIEYAKKRIHDIDEMEYLVKSHYIDEYKSMKKLIEILKYTI